MHTISCARNFVATIFEIRKKSFWRVPAFASSLYSAIFRLSKNASFLSIVSVHSISRARNLRHNFEMKGIFLGQLICSSHILLLHPSKANFSEEQMTANLEMRGSLLTWWTKKRKKKRTKKYSGHIFLFSVHGERATLREEGWGPSCCRGAETFLCESWMANGEVWQWRTIHSFLSCAVVAVVAAVQWCWNILLTHSLTVWILAART